MTETVHLRIDLIEDVIASADAGSAGGAETLDYLPGAMFLGATAARLYDTLGESAFGAFHAGALRFGAGQPLPPGSGLVPALRVPLSIHERKGGAAAAQPPLNLARGDRPADAQLSQLRDRRVAVGGSFFAVRTRRSLRTALDESGRAKEGMLHSRAAIEAGQSFIASVSGEPELVSQAVTVLTGKGVRFGRSRSAEFGVVDIEAVAPQAFWPELSECAEPGRVVFWAVSDVALLDAETGAPRLEPRAGDFSLPDEWQLDLDRSFLRVRRYSPFNAKRRSADRERQVIAAGSVIAFACPGQQLDLAQVRSAVVHGVGAHRQDGLGAVLVEPELLRSAEVRLAAARPEVAAPAASLEPNDELARWASARQRQQSALREAGEEAAGLVARLPKHLRASQWGEVRNILREARARANEPGWLPIKLKEHVSESRRKLDSAWGRSVGRGRTAGDEFVALVVALLRDHANDVGAAVRVLELAVRDVVRAGKGVSK